jgi:hypothetical protein
MPHPPVPGPPRARGGSQPPAASLAGWASLWAASPATPTSESAAPGTGWQMTILAWILSVLICQSRPGRQAEDCPGNTTAYNTLERRIPTAGKGLLPLVGGDQSDHRYDGKNLWRFCPWKLDDSETYIPAACTPRRGDSEFRNTTWAPPSMTMIMLMVGNVRDTPTASSIWKNNQRLPVHQVSVSQPDSESAAVQICSKKLRCRTADSSYILLGLLWPL